MQGVTPISWGVYFYIIYNWVYNSQVIYPWLLKAGLQTTKERRGLAHRLRELTQEIYDATDFFM